MSMLLVDIVKSVGEKIKIKLLLFINRWNSTCHEAG